MKVPRMVFVGALVSAIAALCAAPVLAQDEPPSPNNIWPNGGKKTMVFIYADTVTASTGLKPERVCMQTNFFKRGQRIVFRASAFDKRTGKPITAKDVKYMYLKIPGLPNQGPFKFGKHGKDPATAPWFWALGWTIPADYPLGVVDFEIVVKTKVGDFGYFKQMPVDAARLTVIP
jgi:hypothetical protein